MKSINAFVAHSFDEIDEPLISHFLKFFDSLKESMDFNWDHAEKAEAKAVSKKVTEKMEDKNLFIGIITGKEYRIEHTMLKSLWKWHYAPKNLFRIGGSDWIIQESGYALAKGMTLLFLIEEGIHLSAGLQGDLEYILFKRDNPSDSFTKIVELMGSIKGRAKDVVSEVSIPPLPPKKEKVEKEPAEQLQLEQEKEKFFRSWQALYKSILTDKDLPKANKHLKEILVDYGEDLAFPPVYWKSVSSYFKVKAGYAEGLDELKELCAKYPESMKPFQFIADALKELKQYSQAALEYLNASKRVEGMQRIKFIAKAAECYAVENGFEFAIDLLLKEFSDVASQGEINCLYMQLALISKGLKDSRLFEAFAEKALVYFPLDHDLRFSLAYLYAEKGFVASSLFHYDFLRDHRPDGSCLNNIGVAYGNLALKSKSVESYKEAIEKYEETLSMANLSSIHIDVGLLDEAESILKKASEKKEYHKNVDIMRTKIKGIREEEDESKKKLLEETRTERRFLASFAEAYSLPHAIVITGDWESKHGVIPIKVEGKIVSGQIEMGEAPSSNVLASALGMALQSTRKRISLMGKLNNRAVEYQLSIQSIWPSPSLLGAGGKTFKGLMIISTDGQLIEVMENEEPGKASFYEMKKVG